MNQVIPSQDVIRRDGVSMKVDALFLMLRALVLERQIAAPLDAYD